MLFVGALNLNFILRPLKLAAGGINGLSVLIENILSINPSFFIFTFQLVLFLLALLFLEKEKSFSAFYATIMYPLYIMLSEKIPKYVIVAKSDIIIASIFGGAVTGFVSGFICKMNKSPGGIVLLSQILYEKYKISISLSNFLINFLILITTFYYLGLNYFLYSLLLIYSNKQVMNKILYNF